MPSVMPEDHSRLTPAEVRALCRADRFHGASTSGLCHGYVQANIVVMSDQYADDFRALCARNPVPCPLLGETLPGSPVVPSHLAHEADVRTDCASYTIYSGGSFVRYSNDLLDVWQEDSVAFFIGCSYSFESALVQNGLIPRHMELGRNVPMYRTKVPLASAGVFSGSMVVSMRPYSLSSLPKVQSLTRPFKLAHGEPVAYGEAGASSLGLSDLKGAVPDFGDPSEIRDGEVAVYWGCGVTPQSVVMNSGLEGMVFGHAPGQMLVLDMTNDQVCQ